MSVPESPPPTTTRAPRPWFTYVVAPVIVVVVVVGGVILALVTRQFEPSGSGVRVDALIVSNPAEVQLQQDASNPLQPASLAKSTKPTIELKLHNLSHKTVDLTGARFVILDYARISKCASAGGLRLSGTYDILLPVDPRRGTSVSTDLNEQLAPDGLGRFRFRFDVPLSAYNDGTVTHVYRLQIQLWHDNDPKPYTVATVLLSFPDAISPGDYSYLWDAASAGQIDNLRAVGGPNAEQCDHANTRLLSSFLTNTGARSTELARLTADVGT